jgi:hypothetical protein
MRSDARDVRASPSHAAASPGGARVVTRHVRIERLGAQWVVGDGNGLRTFRERDRAIAHASALFDGDDRLPEPLNTVAERYDTEGHRRGSTEQHDPAA